MGRRARGWWRQSCRGRASKVCELSRWAAASAPHSPWRPSGQIFLYAPPAMQVTLHKFSAL